MTNAQKLQQLIINETVIDYNELVELADKAVKDEQILMEVIENLQEMEDEGEVYETIEDVWPDYPSKDDFFFNEDEY